MEFEQDGRLCRIASPLGEDVLFLQELTGHEGISELFHFELLVIANDQPIDFSGIVGQLVTLTIELAGGEKRYINGLVSRFAQTGADLRTTSYRAEIVPSMWLLTRRTDCRIFQEMNVLEIVDAVFQKIGFTEFEIKTSGAYEPVVNCVQYRETDFNFVSRLLEDAGIHYFFRHEDGKHTLVLADAPSHNEDMPLQKDIRFDNSPEANQEEDQIEDWLVDQVLQPSNYALCDYNYLDPSTSLMVGTGSQVTVGKKKELEIYDYPGVYRNLGGDPVAGKISLGDQMVKIRAQEGDCQAVVHRGEGRCRNFVSGYKFDLKEHPTSDLNTTYLLTTVDHFLTQRGNLASGADVTAEYRNTFRCIPHAVPFRPSRITRKPQVRGPQTATVTGKSGEEIYTDQFGRVKVRFHWDRAENKGENASCWIRVAQNLAGKEWGMIFHPRIGQEVIVDFLEGDPDLPIITGRVYNAQQPIPYSEPTQSGIKTRSTKGGSTDNFNEIRFEDLKGSEELYFHAEKNQTILVENDKSESVGHDETVEIGNDETRTVGSNETLSVGADRSVTVGSNESLSVGSNRSRNVGGRESVTVSAARTHTVGGNEAITVGGAQEVTVGGARAVTVGGEQNLTVGEDLNETVGQKMSLTVAEDGALVFGKKLAIEAADELSIVVGKAKITLKKDGTIQIDGKDLTLKGSGKITAKASKDVIIKGSKVVQN